MKKALVIIGIGLMAGAVVCVLLKKTMGVAITAPKEDVADISPDNNVIITNLNSLHSDGADLYNVKVSTIGTMSARHEEASKIMKDAVEIICKQSAVSADENRELEQISDGLDKLLSEE